MIAIVFVACRPSPEQSAVPAKPLPISLPDLSGMEPAVQQQMRDAFASMTMKREDPSTPPAVLGRAYGEMGDLFLAAEYVGAAEPCFLNAELLVPSEIRWPYFLGHVYRTRGEPAKAAAAFERALKLQPTDLAALVAGCRESRPGPARSSRSAFVRALTEQPQSVAALVGRVGRRWRNASTAGRSTSWSGRWRSIRARRWPAIPWAWRIVAWATPHARKPTFDSAAASRSDLPIR
jgi:tetratricopeptide (TPR) repeat protein